MITATGTSLADLTGPVERMARGWGLTPNQQKDLEAGRICYRCYRSTFGGFGSGKKTMCTGHAVTVFENISQLPAGPLPQEPL